jgi:hypothetical protein
VTSRPVDQIPQAFSGKDRKDYRLVGRFVAGRVPRPAPPGLAYRVRKGETLLVSMHYTPDGTPRKDRTQVGIRFSRDPKVAELTAAQIFNAKFTIPPNVADHVVVAERKLEEDVWAYSFAPHMHLRGKSMMIEAEYATGKKEILFSVPQYRFDWQQVSYSKEPVKLPKGTLIRVVGRYDNSAANPYNPDPSVTVKSGLQTTDEMLFGFIEWSTQPPK